MLWFYSILVSLHLVVQAVIGAKYIHKYIHQSEGSEWVKPTNQRAPFRVGGKCGVSSKTKRKMGNFKRVEII